MIVDDLELMVSTRMPSELRLLLRPCEHSGITGISGTVRGPFCEFAKTLTADFPLKKTVHAGLETDSVEALVLDPCYWTPHLPYHYELQCTLKNEDGTEQSVLAKTGVMRSHCVGANLQMNLKRIVLRGQRSESPDDAALWQSREDETSLILGSPDLRVCELASRWGIPLVVDLRAIDRPWQESCRQLEWFPAVMMVLLSAEQLATRDPSGRWPLQNFAALCVDKGSTAEQIAQLKFDTVVVELQDKKRPPAWIANCDVPVLAIQQGLNSTDLSSARTACDRLQAKLAPEFDLAGYFVSP